MAKIDAEVTEAQAKGVLDTLRRMNSDPLWACEDHSKLHEPGFHADGWTISWEDGPEHWQSALKKVYNHDHNSELWLDSVSNWCVVIHLRTH